MIGTKKSGFVSKWLKTSERPPVMEDFALPQDIEHEKKNPLVMGFSTTVEISYIETPDGLFHDAEVYIPFNGKTKWYMNVVEGRKEVGTPKYWRKKE